ncbi:MAG: DNA repair protein RecN [Bacteroidetes bacterium]|nr:MAG: DNA repair protein RecN [Bacteroidota bacterium]
MLSNLLIKNYVLIENLEIQPSESLNIITGETGAGKSIILGALGLLLGNRADTKILFHQNEKCIIEGEFKIENPEIRPIFEQEDLDFDPNCTIRREISPNGKTRAFINDTPVNLPTLKNIANRLVDIHSQHDTLLLETNEFQLKIVDIYAQNQQIYQAYLLVYRQFLTAEREYEKLKKEIADYLQEFDYNHYLLDELLKANLDSLDQDDLEEQLSMLENVENIKVQINAVLYQLTQSEYSAEESLRQAKNTLNSITSFSKTYESLGERLGSVFIEIRDIISELESEEEGLYFDGEKFQYVQNQLDALYKLQKKHNVESLAELRKIQADLQIKVEKVSNSDMELEELRLKKEKIYSELLLEAQKLTDSRQQTIPIIEQELDRLLRFVGIPEPQLCLQLTAVKPELSGADQVKFLFSANRGIAPQELKNVASGGEFARLMLCIKRILAGKTALPTIIFDEIDTGISGEIAIKVGKLLHEMSKEHQLLIISHLPQTASINGASHYFVYKDNSTGRTISRVKKLSKDERVSEIAQMIGGHNPSNTAMKSAKELLEMY